MNTYQFSRQHFASFLLAPLLLWLFSSIAWVQLALDSVPDSLRGKALFLVAAALAALGWLFVRFFKFVSAPKLIVLDFVAQQLSIENKQYGFEQLKYCLITQNNKAFKIELELLGKAAYASQMMVKSPQLYDLQGDAAALKAAVAEFDMIELHMQGQLKAA
ncbi:hypothetical protein JYB87_18065 [Shewanella avicenniae]|uniref:Uncharacterized protein n=1 Tax=Shewanella avicenniae TaxID=2814294 RepID=A0ABX7QQ37_9GAMM|nr:hypothetical protein [Shewanella avicenniae]QSX33587.1 hypothetical protein JYB87_18065 [Shewanella avicenniae]